MGNASSSNEESFQTHYTLGKQLGKGAQGRVYVCLDKRTGASHAVKMIDRSVKTSWTTFRREVELCKAGCSHHVVGTLADFADAEYCYIVMEKFEGHLRKGLKWMAKEDPTGGQGVGEATLRSITSQVLKGILHLHRCSIIHRDVKSHNVFVDTLDLRDERCRIVLGDLGLARRLEHGRFLCAQVGTRKYWAPELYDKRYSHVVDVFALGVLFFLVACSRYPYFDEDQTRHRDVFKDGCAPQGLSPVASDFLTLLLQKDPSKRPSALSMSSHSWLMTGSESSEKRQHVDWPGGGNSLPDPSARALAVPFAPQVCCHWQSYQIPKMQGDAADGLDADSMAADQECNQERSQVESLSATCKRHQNEERTPSTPTTADMSSATVSPSTKSVGTEGEKYASAPCVDLLEQDTLEDGRSWESATGRADEQGDPLEITQAGTWASHSPRRSAKASL